MYRIDCSLDKNKSCSYYDPSSTCKDCEYYNPKMTFFEAWEKAKEGDKLVYCYHLGGIDRLTMTKTQIQHLRYDCGSLASLSALNAEKWSIITKKKTVTHEIPEEAKNIRIHWGDGVTTTMDTKDCTKKLTYEIDG